MTANPAAVRSRVTFEARDYDLGATLDSGQAFRWQKQEGDWIGIVSRRWVRLRQVETEITAEVSEPSADWGWLTDYLQLGVDLGEVVDGFPDDEPMRAAVAACRGLRLLRQDPWECLASFILSSSKQIVQIRQVVALLSERFGAPLTVPDGQSPAFAFPSPAKLARIPEADLRECRMGFRAAYLRETAQAIATGQFDLARLYHLSAEDARTALMTLPGVGPKIANCVLLFAYGFQTAFPVDVWVMKALRELYFPRARVSVPRLHRFAASHFGPFGGYAQQYLFHYVRTRKTRAPQDSSRPAPRVVVKAG